jgi:hypothetical protein
MFGTEIGGVKLINALRKGMENLKPEEAELIRKYLKKGTVGSALMLIGFLYPENVGGFYQPGKRDPKDVEADGLRLFGVNISHHLLRAPPIFCLQAGATLRRVYNAAIKRGKSGPIAALDATVAVGKGIEEQLPGTRTGSDIQKLERDPANFFAKQFLDRAVPRFITKIYEWTTGKKIMETKKPK